jgi:hypothetical protein
MPNGGVNPAGIKIALGSRNWNGGIRQDTLFEYLRVGPLVTADFGSARYVGAAYTSAVIYGLTQGLSYTFTVAAHTAAGWGPESAPFGAVGIPTLSTAPAALGMPVVISTAAACKMSTYYGTMTYPCTNANDGIFNNFAHSNCAATADYFQYE